MKTLTKILSVTALIVLCVCLFTLTAFAATLDKVNAEDPASCTTEKNGIAAHLIVAGKYYKGTHGYTTADEGKDLTDAEVAALGSPVSVDSLIIPWAHDMDPALKVDTAATCLATGVGHYECKNCGSSKHFSNAAGTNLGDVTIPKAAHTPGSPTGPKAPTCLESGYIQYYTCTVSGCGKLCNATGTVEYSFDDVFLPPDPTQHKWGAWEVTKPQTNVSPGQQKRTCSVCGDVEFEEIPADGITDATPIYYVIATRDVWMRGEEPLTFESNLVEKLNRESGPNANYVGVRIGTDSLYENSYDTFDFWSWDGYVKLGEKTMAGLREGTYRLWIYDKNHPDVYTNSAVFYVVDVPTLEPYSTDKHVVNSSKSLRFIASEEIRPDSVQVGSRKLYDSNDYFVSNDRKNITLSPDFLNARQTGTYTISALTKDGRTIKTNFYILSTAQASSSPRTGDESQIGLWAAFLLLSGAAIVVMVPKLRKHGVK